MSSGFKYKGTDISQMISSGGTNPLTGYGSVTYKTTTNAYDRVDSGFINNFLTNGSPITNIQTLGYSYTSTGSITVPSWANALKLYIETSLGSAGSTGPTGAAGDNGAAGNNFGANVGGQGGQGGPGGPGGPGGAAGDGLITYTPTIYTFSTSSLSCTFNGTGGTIDLVFSDSTNGNSFEIKANAGGRGNDGATGGTGNNGNNGNDAVFGANGNRGNNGNIGNTGTAGNKGSNGAITTTGNLSTNQFTSTTTNNTTNKLTVYFFAT